jgi:thiamine monophosphate synthase
VSLPPPLLVLTDRTQCRGSLVDTVAAAVDAGACAVVLREKDLPEAERDRLADALGALLVPVGGLLIRAGAARPGSTGPCHLAAADPFPTVRPVLVGRSCHDRAELQQAREEGCDYVMVSPVFPSASKPGYGPALGPAGLARLVDGAPPAWALGGIGPDDVAGCLRAGARGIAVMGLVMRHPGSVVAFLSALEEVAA